MFWMGRDMGFRMAGMPMDGAMIAGMWMIVAGIGVAAYGLLPRGLSQQIEASSKLAVSAPEDAPLSAAPWRLMAVLFVARSTERRVGHEWVRTFWSRGWQLH